MPGIVKVAGFAGLLFWLLLLAIFAINLFVTVEPAAPDIDRVVLPFGFALSIAGSAVCVALLRAKPIPYRAFVMSLDLIAFTAALTVLIGITVAPAAASAGAAVCTITVLLRLALVQDKVRAFFSLAPRNPVNLVRGVAWMNIVGGVVSLPNLIWPLPTPMFGVWLSGWQLGIGDAVLIAVTVAVGIGILGARQWVRVAVVFMSVASLLYVAGIAWDPNPQGRLKAGEATTAGFIVGMLIFTIGWVAASCWLVYWRWDQIEAARQNPHPSSPVQEQQPD